MYGCGCPCMRLGEAGRKKPNFRMPLRNAAKEMMDDRDSQSTSLDPAMSYLNTYITPDGVGTSGKDVYDFFEGRKLEQSAKQKAAGGSAVRKDTDFAMEFIISPNAEFFEGRSRAEIDQFFDDAADVYADHFGQKPLVRARHRDEGVEHEQWIDDAPVRDADGSYHPRKMGKVALREWHDAFVEGMNAKGWEVSPHVEGGEGGKDANEYAQFKEREHELDAREQELDARKSVLDGRAEMLAEREETANKADDRVKLAWVGIKDAEDAISTQNSALTRRIKAATDLEEKANKEQADAWAEVKLASAAKLVLAGVVRGYQDWLRARNPDLFERNRQAWVDFMNLVETRAQRPVIPSVGQVDADESTGHSRRQDPTGMDF